MILEFQKMPQNSDNLILELKYDPKQIIIRNVRWMKLKDGLDIYLVPGYTF